MQSPCRKVRRSLALHIRVRNFVVAQSCRHVATLAPLRIDLYARHSGDGSNVPNRNDESWTASWDSILGQHPGTASSHPIVPRGFHARLAAQMGMESPGNRPAVDDRSGLMTRARGEAIFSASAFGGSMDKPAIGGFFVA